MSAGASVACAGRAGAPTGSMTRNWKGRRLSRSSARRAPSAGSTTAPTSWLRPSPRCGDGDGRGRHFSTTRPERLLGLRELGRRALGVRALLLGLFHEQLGRPLSLDGGLFCDSRLVAQRPRLGAQRGDALAGRARDLVARAATRGLDRLERPEPDRLQLLGESAALEERATLFVDGRRA